MGAHMAGNVLGGRYTVQDRIGTGGMAIVYRGLDNVLGRTVAIKTMLPQYANDPSFAARFKQEAQAAAALQSPYIVSVYDWGKDGDTYFIVMEYIRAPTSRPASCSAVRSTSARSPKSARRCARRFPSPITRTSSTATSSRRTSWSSLMAT